MPRNHQFDLGENAQQQWRATIWAPGTKQDTRSLRYTLKITQNFYVCTINANTHVSTTPILRRQTQSEINLKKKNKEKRIRHTKFETEHTNSSAFHLSSNAVVTVCDTDSFYLGI